MSNSMSSGRCALCPDSRRHHKTCRCSFTLHTFVVLTPVCSEKLELGLLNDLLYHLVECIFFHWTHCVLFKILKVNLPQTFLPLDWICITKRKYVLCHYFWNFFLKYNPYHLWKITLILFIIALKKYKNSKKCFPLIFFLSMRTIKGKIIIGFLRDLLRLFGSKRNILESTENLHVSEAELVSNSIEYLLLF